MRLLERLGDRFRDAQGYYEGMASGAAVLMTWGEDDKREKAGTQLVAQAQQAYETNGVVFACMLARIMLLSEVTFKLRSLTSKKLYGTEDLRILEYPWENATAGELVARMEQDVSLAGNAFVAKVEDDELFRLPPAEVTIISEEVTSSLTGATYKRPIGYDWDPKQGISSLANYNGGRNPKAQHFTVDEIAHWSPIPDPLANFRGMSWLSPILREVYADTAMLSYKTMYLDRGQPVQAVKYAAKLQPATIDAVVERMMAKYGGVSNAWRPLIIDQGGDPMMSAPLKDLDYRAVQAGGEHRICMAAGVPSTVVGLQSAESNETFETAMRRFSDMYARWAWRTLCATLQKFVPNIPARGVQLWYDTSDIAALQAAETERAQVTQVHAAATLTLVQAGFTRDSVLSAVASGDWSLLVPDPDAPTPGVVERETITAPTPFGATGQPDPQHTTTTGSSGARPPRTGTPPGGPQALQTQPQTPASKKPMPGSFPTPATKGAPNGKI